MRAALLLACLAACSNAAEPTAPYAWSLPPSFPIPTVPPDNPMTAEKVELGRFLFHDTRLSADGTQSCASCHDQTRAFTDGRATPIGITGEHGRRNAMSLANVAYNSSNTWASHVVRLEDQARLPMFGTSPVELGLATREAELLERLRSTPVYVALFAEAEEDISVEAITRALASFERTIISGRSRFDAFVRGDSSAMSPSEQRGLALFESERLGCQHCHGGFNLASAVGDEVRLFNTGLYNVDGAGGYPASDRGLIEVTNVASDMGRFRAPTLRNIALTAPYFHDGSAPTLETVLDHYASGGVASPFKSPFITGFTLSTAERADVIAFLGALTDDSLLTDSALASPW